MESVFAGSDWNCRRTLRSSSVRMLQPPSSSLPPNSGTSLRNYDAFQLRLEQRVVLQLQLRRLHWADALQPDILVKFGELRRVVWG